jgi:hypothetical protein
MNRQETKSPAYSVLVRRLAAYLVDVLLLFAAVVSTQSGGRQEVEREGDTNHARGIGT